MGKRQVRKAGGLMDATRQIQAIVARADLILCWAGRVLAVAMLAAILLTVLILVWRFSNMFRYGRPTHYIDYDAPGVDITSEGPEDGDPWYDEDTWFKEGRCDH